MVLMDEELTVLRVEPNEPLLQQSQVTPLSGILYDQFGELNEGQTTDFGTVLLVEPMTHGVIFKKLPSTMANSKPFRQKHVRPDIMHFTQALPLQATGYREE